MTTLMIFIEPSLESANILLFSNHILPALNSNNTLTLINSLLLAMMMALVQIMNCI